MKSLKTIGNKDFYILSANMGSCQCGDVRTRVIVDHESKTVISGVYGYAWMSGKLRGDSFSVPYAGGFDLPSLGYNHVIRGFSDYELAQF